MKASELRIGNYLTEGQVTSITASCIWNHCEELYLYDELEPIELNEELLVGCGFLKNNNEYYINKCPMFTVTTHIYSKNDFVVDWGDVKVKEIIYLHELQNIYFALNGEELIFKK